MNDFIQYLQMLFSVALSHVKKLNRAAIPAKKNQTVILRNEEMSCSTSRKLVKNMYYY